MKLFKRILPLFLLILLFTTVASCKKDNKTNYSYPSEVPTYTSKDTFLKVGDLTVTKENVYNRLLNSYGVETLEFLLDDYLLKAELTSEEQAEFEKSLNKRIYGDNYNDMSDEEKEEALAKFEENCLSTGLKVLDSEKNNKLHYENYYKLEFKRELATVKALKKEAEDQNAKAKEDSSVEAKYAESDYLTFFNGKIHPLYTMQLVVFSSYAEALAALENAGVNDLNGEWKDSSDHVYTKDELAAIFDNLATAAYGEVKADKVYKYAELAKLSATGSTDTTIANKVSKLNTSELSTSYTHAPISFSGKWFLAFVKSTSDDYYYDNDETVKFNKEVIKEYNADGTISKLDETIYPTLLELLVKEDINASNTAYKNNTEKVLLKLRQDAGLEIFSEGLEVAYKANYENVYSSLGITDYDAFKATTNTSSTVVAKINGLEINLDAMYQALTDRYGVLLSLLFVQQYAVLGSEYNKVINYSTLEVLDQTKYAEYVATDYTAYKEAFETGSYEANGYPASYGWENFMRDYLGVTSEKEIVVDFSSDLYNDVLDLYTKALYMAELSDVELYLPDGGDAYFLKSAKWTKEYNVLDKALVKEGTTPTLSLAYEEKDIEGVAKKHDTAGNEVDYKKEEYYGHFVITYTNPEGNEVKALTNITVDQRVMETYDEIYNASFTATVSGFYAYYDVDLDGKADDIEGEENLEKRNLAKALTDDIWYYAYSLYQDDVVNKQYPRKTVLEYIQAALRTYSTSTDAIWTNYKKAGLVLATVSSVSYTRTTSQSEELLDDVKTMWEELRTLSSSVMGQTIDPIYRWIENDEVKNVKAMDIANTHEAILSNNAYYRLVITKPTSITAYTYTSSTQEQKPNYYLYTQYLLSTDKRETTIYCSSQFTNYYNPAISQLSSSDIVNKKIMTDAKELLSKVEFSSNNDANKDVLTKLINASLAK